MVQAAEAKSENEGILEQMQKAVSAPDPGELRARQVLSSKEDELPTIVGQINTAGYSYVWDNLTGEKSVVSNNMLSNQLNKKRLDGSRIFTTTDPHIKVKRGNLKCLLHPDDPNRKHYDEIGFPVCTKPNLTSPMQVELHMKATHKQPWKTIERERQDKEKAEDKEFQRSLIKLAQGQGQRKPDKIVGTEERPLYIKDQ